MCGESARLRAQIQPEDPADEMGCVLCDDPLCREWATLWTEPDPEHDNARWPLCHVSECEMHDTEEP